MFVNFRRSLCFLAKEDCMVIEHWHKLTAFSSPRFARRAKCALRLAFALFAVTPHSARSTLDRLRINTLAAFGIAGERQSKIIAVSLKMSAARRYILHSGSREVPSR